MYFFNNVQINKKTYDQIIAKENVINVEQKSIKGEHVLCDYKLISSVIHWQKSLVEYMTRKGIIHEQRS